MNRLKKQMRVLTVFLIGALTLSACSTTGSVPGELRLATAQPSNTLSSLTSSEAVNGAIIGNFQEGLITYDENGDLIGSMAESWTISEDGTIYTFKLKDSKWANGTPVTAADFVFAWRKVLELPQASNKNLLEDIKGAKEIIAGKAQVESLAVTAVTDKELEVELVGPRAYFLDLLAYIPFYPVNEAFYNQVGEANYGTTKDTVLANGPFAVTEYSADKGYTLEKNDMYWGASSVSLNKVSVRVVEQPETQATLYEKGEIERLALSGSLVDKHASSDEVVVQEEPTMYFFYMSGTTKQEDEVLANKNFRAAGAHAIDKTIIADNILKNGSLPADYLVPVNFVSQDGKDFREVSGNFNNQMFDVKKAGEYLTNAKSELGQEQLSFTITTTDSELSKKIYENVKSQIETNLPNVSVNLNLIPSGNFYKTINEGETPAATAGWGPDFRDVATFFGIFLTGDSHNYGRWSNPAYDTLYASALNEADPMKRWQIFAEMEKILLDDYAIVPMYQRGSMALVKPNVQGLRLNATSPDMFFKYVTVE